MAKKKSKKKKKSSGGKKGGSKARKSKQIASAKSPGKTETKDESSSKSKASDDSEAKATAKAKDEPAAKEKDKPTTETKEKDEPVAKAKEKAKPTTATKAKAPDKAKSSEPAKPEQEPPELVKTITMVDNAIGYVEQGFLVFALFSLIAVGTYQFVASHIFSINHTWPFGALRHLVFFTAMGGAALAAQKGRMISMDFLARKFSPKNRVILRILISFFVIFTCYLLFKGGMFVRNAAEAHHEVLPSAGIFSVIFEKLINVISNPKIALLMLPIGAALIAVHYALHAITDAIYLSAGQIPPEEEGPAGH